MIKQELNEDLKPIAQKVMNGDFLNIPLLSKPDFEKITFSCIAELNFLIKNVIVQLDDITEEVTREEPEPIITKKGRR